MPLAVINRTKFVLPRPLFSRLWARAQPQFPVLAKKAVVLVFVGPAESLRLNSRYRRRQKPANILSFKSGEEKELGDILLCPSAAKAQARQSGVSFQALLARLFVHGLLHLLGFDHRTGEEENKMEKAARKILAE